MIVSQDTSTTSPLPTRSILLVVVAGLLAGCGLYEDVEPVPEGVPARLLEIDPGTANIGVGETRKVTLSRPDGSQIPGSAVSWSSIDEGIATVDEKGIVTGTGEGSVQIEAVWKGAVKSSAFSVTYQIKSISIDQQMPTIELGSTKTLSATVVTPSDVMLSGAPIDWESSNSAIIEIDDAGKMTAKQAGSVTITASLKGESATAEVTVDEPTKSLVVEPQARSMALGEKFCANATALNVNDNPIDGRDVSWTSGDSEVVTVTKSGAANATVEALKTGMTELTAESQMESVTIPIDVSKFVDVAAGQNFTCGLNEAGVAFCWGNNDNGALGDGTTSSRKTPKPVSLDGIDPAPEFTDLAAGLEHICGITADKNVYCWGRNNVTQLGLGPEADDQKTQPTEVDVPGDVVDLGLGFIHSCAVTNSGDVYCWGGNGCGQLGSGAPRGCETNMIQASRTPRKVDTSVKFESVSGGEKHTCGLSTDGDVYCWGWLKDGQLGNGEMNGVTPDPDGDTTDDGGTMVDVKFKKTPQKVDPSSAMVGMGGPMPQTPFVDVEVGQVHSCALDSAGSLYCWGQNSKKQAGALCEYEGTDGSMMSQTYDKCAKPAYIPLGMGVKGEELFAGSNHMCLREESGKTVCWGRGEHLELGNGSNTDDSYDPVHPQTVEDLLVLTSGGGLNYESDQGAGYTCAATTSGNILCWGVNPDGALGEGTTSQHANPTSIEFAGCQASD